MDLFTGAQPQRFNDTNARQAPSNSLCSAVLFTRSAGDAPSPARPAETRCCSALRWPAQSLGR